MQAKSVFYAAYTKKINFPLQNNLTSVVFTNAVDPVQVGGAKNKDLT
jgi:hypothetical protein